MIINFKKNKRPILPLSITNTEVEQINTFKFLDTHISNDLNWNKN